MFRHCNFIFLVALGIFVGYSQAFVPWGSMTKMKLNRLGFNFKASVDNAIMNTAGAPLKQLQIRFNCDDVDSDDLSELLFEVGTLSVSVEVESEKDVMNDQTKWVDLIKTKSWDTALLRANFPSSYNSEGLLEILAVAFPDVIFKCTVVDVENRDWVSDVQKTWKPQQIGNLTIRFPWHIVEDNPFIADDYHSELVLEGGAAFGTGELQYINYLIL
jgi:ribosomal protein L11 methylase PrmA